MTLRAFPTLFHNADQFPYLSFRWDADQNCIGHHLKPYESYNRTLRDARKKHLGKSPTSPEEIRTEFAKLSIMDRLGTSLHHEKGVLYNGIQIEEDYCNCFFSSPKSIKLVKEHLDPSERFFVMDATFRVTPQSTFEQVLIIHIRFGIKVRTHARYVITMKLFFTQKDPNELSHFLQTYPLVYVLMKRRTTEAYVNAFKFIDEKIIELIGSGIIIDFENAMRAALKIVCPNLPILGCLFHYVQAIQRKMKSIPELYLLIRTNEKAKFIFRKIQCLALLPAHEIMNGFVILLREALETEKLVEFAPFFQYYKTQWLERVTPAHYSVFNKITRTTGSAEAFNGKINKKFRTHPAFFQFVESLQAEELVKTKEFERDVSGIVQRDKRKTHDKQRDSIIRRYSKEFEEKRITMKHFLCVVANPVNGILYKETEQHLEATDIDIAVNIELFNGNQIEPDVILQDALEAVSKKKAPTKSRSKKRTLEKPTTDGPTTTTPEVELTHEPPAKRTRSKAPANQNKNQKKAPAKPKKSQKKAESNTCSVDLGERCDASTSSETQHAKNSSQTRMKRNEKSKQHEHSDDSDSDGTTLEIMTHLTRSGPALARLRKRFNEIMDQDEIDIDPDCYKCILCLERKKNVVLFPCLHQHTCEACWFAWKVEQINQIPIQHLDDSTFDDIVPKCPYCRNEVDRAEKVRN